MTPTDYQETNPFSRNLILFSMSIIVFILGDGRLYSESDDIEYLKISLINVRLYNLEYLKYLIIIIYFWFNYRFWQSEKSTIADIINNDTCTYTNCPLSKKYMRFRNGTDFDYKYTIGLVKRQEWEVFASNGSIQIIQHKILSGFIDKCFLFYIKLKILFFDSRVITNRFPYLLSFVALCLYIKKYYL